MLRWVSRPRQWQHMTRAAQMLGIWYKSDIINIVHKARMELQTVVTSVTCGAGSIQWPPSTFEPIAHACCVRPQPAPYTPPTADQYGRQKGSPRVASQRPPVSLHPPARKHRSSTESRCTVSSTESSCAVKGEERRGKCVTGSASATRGVTTTQR